MRAFVLASLCLVLAASAALGSPVGSCAAFSGKGGISYLRDDRNCSVFYECVSSEPTMVVCPNGLHFNAVLKVCDWPAASGCAVAPSPAASASIRVTPDTQESADEQTVVFTTSTEAAPVDALPLQPVEPSACPAVGGCPKVDVGGSLVIQLPHAFNCSRFCKCDHGRAVTFECPTGLHYNKNGGYCDWPANAMCQPDRGFAYSWDSAPGVPYQAAAPSDSSRQRRSWSLGFH